MEDGELSLLEVVLFHRSPLPNLLNKEEKWQVAWNLIVGRYLLFSEGDKIERSQYSLCEIHYFN